MSCHAVVQYSSSSKETVLLTMVLAISVATASNSQLLRVVGGCCFEGHRSYCRQLIQQWGVAEDAAPGRREDGLHHLCRCLLVGGGGGG